MWDSRSREWVERRDYSHCWIRFQLPDALSGAELTGARLFVQVAGPVIEMQVFGLANPETPDAKPVLVERWNDPVGAHAFEISDRNVLSLFDGGAFFLGLNAGDPQRKPDVLAGKRNEPKQPPVGPPAATPNPANPNNLEEIKTSPWKIVHLELQLTGKIPTATPDR
jgi:hypothetical protein